MADTNGAFSELVRDFGGGAQEKKEKDEEAALDAIEDDGDAKPVDAVVKKGKALMQEEERASGAVSGHGACPPSARRLDGSLFCPIVYGKCELQPHWPHRSDQDQDLTSLISDSFQSGQGSHHGPASRRVIDPDANRASTRSASTPF